MTNAKTPKPLNTVNVVPRAGETNEQTLARLILTPSLKATHTISAYSINFGSDMDVSALHDNLSASIERIKENDLSDTDGLLITQAHTLDTMFHKFMQMALTYKHLDDYKTVVTLALKAQNQSRMTLETLAEVKNPRPYIQNNRAHYQQVNNGKSSTRGEKPKATNELLEDKTHDNQWLDTRTAATPGTADKELATVATQHRAED